MTIDAPEWMEDRTLPCKGNQANGQPKVKLFFAPYHGGITGSHEHYRAKESRERQAKALCAFCPHQKACRDYAREHRLHGLWGGETEEERGRAGRGAGTYDGRAYRAHREGQRNQQETA